MLRAFTLASLLVLVPVTVGCVGPSREAASSNTGGDAGGSPTAAQGVPGEPGDMTATEKREDAARLCQSGGLPFPPQGMYCAQRKVTITGEIRLDRLPVSLATFNGQVAVEDGRDGAWSLVATLSARGATEEEAKRNLDNVLFAWEHTDGARHFLSAKAELKREAQTQNLGGYGASLTLAVPANLALTLAAATSNGDVRVEGVRADSASLASSNGNVAVDATARDVEASTSNGDVDAKLRPSASGSIALSTSDGAITLAVPEGARHGYDVDAVTSRGDVSIDLRDGSVSKRTDTVASFRTRDYAAREVRSEVALSTSNGDVHVKPL